jgi:hypothetical protein
MSRVEAKVFSLQDVEEVFYARKETKLIINFRQRSLRCSLSQFLALNETANDAIIITRSDRRAVFNLHEEFCSESEAKRELRRHEAFKSLDL